MDSGRTALTVALVPTGVKAGVWICPCGVVMTPARPRNCPPLASTRSALGEAVSARRLVMVKPKSSVGKELSRTLILLSIVCFPSECLHPSLPENPASLAGGGVHENLAEGSWV